MIGKLVLTASLIATSASGAAAQIIEQPARPLRDPQTWLDLEDYPSTTVRMTDEGTVRALLTIGANGRVLDCKIVRASGSMWLDRQTCILVRRRGRFDAAKDMAGNAVEDVWLFSYTWRFPSD